MKFIFSHSCFKSAPDFTFQMSIQQDLLASHNCRFPCPISFFFFSLLSEHVAQETDRTKCQSTHHHLKLFCVIDGVKFHIGIGIGNCLYLFRKNFASVNCLGQIPEGG